MAFYSSNTFRSAPVKMSPYYGMWDSQFPAMEIITAIDVAGLKILIKTGAVDHIFEKHGQDFEYAARGSFNLEAREYQVANYIKESILNASEIFITDYGVSRADSLALYYKRTCDKMYHRFFLAHEGGNVYRINTGYKLIPVEQFFLLNWVKQNNGGMQQQVSVSFNNRVVYPKFRNIYRRRPPVICY